MATIFVRLAGRAMARTVFHGSLARQPNGCAIHGSQFTVQLAAAIGNGEQRTVNSEP